MLTSITPGATGTASLVVSDERTAPRVGSGKVHVLATPVGMRVNASATVLKVDGRTVMFSVEARDEKELIGEGTHERVVVNVAKFDERVRRKTRGN